MMSAHPNAEFARRTRLKGWEDRFVEMASEPGDGPEMRLRKSLGLAFGLGVLPAYFMQGLFFLAVGATATGWLALAGGTGYALLCAWYLHARRYYPFARASVLLQLVVLLSGHLTLGGFSGSGYLLIFALAAPLLAPVVDDPGVSSSTFWGPAW